LACTARSSLDRLATILVAPGGVGYDDPHDPEFSNGATIPAPSPASNGWRSRPQGLRAARSPSPRWAVILSIVIAMAVVNIALIPGVVLLVVSGKALLFFAKLGDSSSSSRSVWLMLRTTWTLVSRFRGGGARSAVTRQQHCSPASTRCATDRRSSRIALVTDELNAAIVQRRAWASWAGRVH
jgi:hypothetical protein